MNLPKIQLASERNSDPSYLRKREWLLTNGLGGYASGTLLGCATRKYHGLFVPNLSSPKGRHLMISRFDEELLVDGRRVLLGGGESEQGEYDGDTHRYFKAFTLERGVATWTFDLGGGVELERAIVMPHQQNTVCVRYRLSGGAQLSIRLRPFFAFRRHDGELNPPGFGAFTVSFNDRQFEAQLRASPLSLRFTTQAASSVFVAERMDLDAQLLRLERDHGYAHLESLASPGYFSVQLAPDSPAMFVASTHGWERLEFDTSAPFQAESQRIETLLKAVETLQQDEFSSHLSIVADQFIVLPGARLEETVAAQATGSEVCTVIAGYHWFGDWGRDTMISLEGLTLCTGRFREARTILQTFSHYVVDGLLPNLFPEGERSGLYHTVDATLWYFHAIHRYVERSGDRSILGELLPVLKDIVAHHLHGTRFGIHVDERDGLLAAGAAGYQLTWMDAKVEDWVVTPRRGKPVEVQALWYNALKLMDEWTRSLGEADTSYEHHAARAREAFNRRFWNAQNGCLYDVVDSEAGDDASVRPNQLFAISLRYPILEPTHWPTVIATIERNLLTRYGLRTLSREHPDYKKTYQGDLRSRDAAYHQGTVWPWLLGHFIDAWLKLHHDRARARQMLEAFPDHLREAGVGSISEIFDAEPPHAPHGCIAQAWSIAEILRAWHTTRSD